MASGALRLARTAALAAALAVAGCGGGNGGGGNGEPPAASVNVSLGPIAQTKPVEFDEVPVGRSQTKTVVVSNDTDTEQTLTKPRVLNDAQFAISGGTCAEGTTLAPGERCTVQVTYTPQHAGESEAILEVDPDRAGEMRAPMSGSASAATTMETTPTETTETTPETPPAETPTTDAAEPETSTTGG